MNTKLTLSIDEQVISGAKSLAEAQGTSVSKMVEGILVEQIRNQPVNEEEIGPITRQLWGSAKKPKGKKILDDRYDYLMKKYS